MQRVALLFCSFVFSFNIYAKGFSEFFDDYYRRDASPSVDTERYALQNRYVFVAGFLNEYVPSYWVDVMNSLLRLGVSAEQITLISPPSTKSAEKNSHFLAERIQNIPNDLPLVIIAQGKGALELMNFAWKHPEFIRERVRAQFFVQAPFGGSPIADMFISGNLKVSKDTSFIDKVAMKGQFLAERVFMNSFKKALLDITKDIAKNWQTSLRTEYSDAHNSISNRFFYITSSETVENLSVDIGTTAHYLHRKYNPNDGVVPLMNQSLDFVGETIAYLVADHSDFVQSSNKPTEFRTAFGWALVSWLASQERH